MVFNPVYSSWLTLLIILAFTIFLLWQEWRKQYRFKLLRIISVISMMTALLGILLKPSYKTKTSSAILLLTSGYSKEMVDSILLKAPHSNLMHLGETPSYKSSKRLEDFELVQRAEEIKTVLGVGMPRSDLDRMDTTSFDYLPAALPHGITNLLLPKQNVVGRRNRIKGTFNNTQESRWIFLTGPGGKEDSVLLEKGLNDFQLSFIPRHGGRIVYTLRTDDSINVYREPLPITIQTQQTLSILFLQSYPTFEIQALKNFLEQKKHRIVVRSQVSKNNFRYEYINREPVQAGRLSNELLKETDLIIADDKALSILTPAEKNNLISSIHSGLGLLHMAAIAHQKADMLYPFKTSTVKKDTTTIRIGSRPFTFPASKVRIIPNASFVPLQKNKSGILAGYTFFGAGKIGLQLLQETYQISLSGDSVEYSALWTPLLEALAKPKYEPSKINIITPFPWYEDEPIDIKVIASSENISLSSDSVELPLKEDITVDNVWHARKWAGQPGWHTLETGNGVKLDYFVSPSDKWKSLHLMNQQHANKLRDTGVARSSKEIDVWRKFPPLIFYLIFILSAGFIWLAPKL